MLSLRSDLETAMDKQVFRLVLMEEARVFINSLPQAAKEKVYYNIRKVKGGYKDAELFKKLENSEIWEFRTKYNGICYRLFSFWDKDAEVLVVATHGIIKKTQKTPSKEIAKAEEARRMYIEAKKIK